jgi:hypothetical protein
MTPYEAASLWAQWVGSISAALAVVVAAVFGYLTLLNNRRSKDAQQRASLAAASGEGGSPSHGVLPGSSRSPGPRFAVRHKAGSPISTSSACSQWRRRRKPSPPDNRGSSS